MMNQLPIILDLRSQARQLARSFSDDERIKLVQQFMTCAVTAYFPEARLLMQSSENELAVNIGMYARGLSLDEASYWLGSIYTVMLPDEYRSSKGIYYTPPSITARLLTLCEQAGAQWGSDRILDPACGGGAFLAPVAIRMQEALKDLLPIEALEHIENHLVGFEQDSFAAWLSQTFLEVATIDLTRKAGRPIGNLVIVRDSLETAPEEYGTFNVVIGNPPYGKVKLSEQDRKKWSRSLYGHANYYGLFTDLAERLVAPQGLIAYVTPSSFLGGQYFKNLRALLTTLAPPVAIEFIKARNGVFADVLQETLLAVYRKASSDRIVGIGYIQVQESGNLIVDQGMNQRLPQDPTSPWLLPKRIEEQDIIAVLHHFPFRLSDLGYSVSTGPLVWNRHKDRLFQIKERNSVPLIWAECIDPSGSGVFKHKATRNHALWYLPYDNKDSNIVTTACVLLQRTTAPEQTRRLVAADLPEQFLKKHKGMVSIENHVNMIKPNGKQVLSLKAIARLFNSEVVDQVFRCINGSIAVSAYELNNIPFPNPKDLMLLDSLLEKGASDAEVEEYIRSLYGAVLSLSAA
jgi:adenine-specific DNA-methyltransferase